MITDITQWILETLRYYGGWSVFLGVLIEQIIIPIPSPAVIMGAGWILVPGREPWFSAVVKISYQIVLPGTFASMAGAGLGYYIGLWGGKVFVDRFQNYLGFSWNDVVRMGQRMSRTGMAATMFLMRALPIVPLSLVSIVGGVLKAPIGPYMLWSFLGTIPRCYILGILGWQLGGQTMRWAKGVNRFESLVSLGIVGLVCAGIIYIRWRVRRER